MTVRPLASVLTVMFLAKEFTSCANAVVIREISARKSRLSRCFIQPPAIFVQIAEISRYVRREGLVNQVRPVIPSGARDRYPNDELKVGMLRLRSGFAPRTRRCARHDMLIFDTGQERTNYVLA